MDKNPFQILGLNPDILQDLNDEEILILVNSQYKALQQIFHPDKPRGNEEQSKLLSQTRDLLDPQKNKELFELFKKQFLKKTSKQKELTGLQNLLLASELNYIYLYQKLMDYLSSFAGFTEGLSIYNLPACTLKLHDYHRSLNIRHFEKSEGYAKKGEGNPLYYDLLIDADGKLAEKRANKIKKLPQKKLIGTFDANLVKQKNLTMRYLLSKVLNFWTADQQEYAKLGIIHGDKNIAAIKFTEYKISWQMFGKIAHFLSPKVKQYDYLFSLNRQGEESYFTLDGTIQKIII